jgi:NTP pyrophosphatase (non-canonical NTP hydrolase)
MKSNTSDCKFVVFCYGKKHDRQLLPVASLLSFDENMKDASTKKTKGVNHAFDELKNHPDVYR